MKKCFYWGDNLNLKQLFDDFCLRLMSAEENFP